MEHLKANSLQNKSELSLLVYLSINSYNIGRKEERLQEYVRVIPKMRDFTKCKQTGMRFLGKNQSKPPQNRIIHVICCSCLFFMLFLAPSK